MDAVKTQWKRVNACDAHTNWSLSVSFVLDDLLLWVDCVAVNPHNRPRTEALAHESRLLVCSFSVAGFFERVAVCCAIKTGC